MSYEVSDHKIDLPAILKLFRLRKMYQNSIILKLYYRSTERRTSQKNLGERWSFGQIF